jgi:NitT/TauT family transport system ATP-binding protein
MSYGGDPVLEGASITVGEGQFVSLIGPSGSGKSTLLRAVIGLQAPLRGTIETGVAPSEVGILFQDDALLPWKTACENVALGLTLNGVPGHQAREQAEKWLERLALAWATVSRVTSAAAKESASRSRRSWRVHRSFC